MWRPAGQSEAEVLASALPEAACLLTPDGRVAWEAIPRAVETSTAFHVFFQTDMFQFIPFRAFRSADEISAVREILRTALGERAHGTDGGSTG